MGKNGLKMGVLLSFFYEFAENREFLIGRFLPYKLGIETPAIGIIINIKIQANQGPGGDHDEEDGPRQGRTSFTF